MCIPVICTFPGKPRLSEVLPVLALGWPEHCWAQATLSQEVQEKSCPLQYQGMVQPFPCSLHSTETLGELCSLPTSPSAASRPPLALCPTEETWVPLDHFGQPGGASWKWRWHIQVSLAFSPLVHPTAHPLPMWQPSLCHDQLPKESTGHRLHSQK